MHNLGVHKHVELRQDWLQMKLRGIHTAPVKNTDIIPELKELNPGEAEDIIAVLEKLMNPSWKHIRMTAHVIDSGNEIKPSCSTNSLKYFINNIYFFFYEGIIYIYCCFSLAAKPCNIVAESFYMFIAA